MIKISVRICPHCRMKYTTAGVHGGQDYEHVCSSGKDILDFEDRFTVGFYEDYKGDPNLYTSGGAGEHLQATNKGVLNKLQGTFANIEHGARVGEFTVRGNRNATNRIRRHVEYIGSNVDSSTDYASPTTQQSEQY